MNPKLAWFIAFIIGSSLGLALGVFYTDVWFGLLLAIVSTVAIAGIVSYPEHFITSPLSKEDAEWDVLSNFLVILVIIVPLHGTVFAEAEAGAVVLFLAAVITAGISAGIKLERESSKRAEPDTSDPGVRNQDGRVVLPSTDQNE